jgi:hypothetical protein
METTNDNLSGGGWTNGAHEVKANAVNNKNALFMP